MQNVTRTCSLHRSKLCQWPALHRWHFRSSKLIRSHGHDERPGTSRQQGHAFSWQRSASRRNGEKLVLCDGATVAAWSQVSGCTLSGVAPTCQSDGFKTSPYFWSLYVLSRVLKCHLRGAQYVVIFTTISPNHHCCTLVVSPRAGGSEFSPKTPYSAGRLPSCPQAVKRVPSSQNQALAGTLCCDARGNSGCGFCGCAHWSKGSIIGFDGFDSSRIWEEPLSLFCIWCFNLCKLRL